MKKLFFFIFSALLAVLLSACCGEAVETNTPTEPVTEGTDAPTEAVTDAPLPPAEDFVLDIGGNYEKHTEKAVYTFYDEAVNTVKKEIFGDNLAWRGNGYGVYDPQTKSFNEKLVEAIKNSGVTNIRYPGGIEGDYFIWHETIGNSRKAQIDPFSDSYPTNAPKSGVKYYPFFGFDEFFELCRLAEVEPVVQLNAGTGSAKDAAGLVKYCIEKGIDVSSFAIGNEVHFKAEPVDGVRSTKTAEEYIAFANEVYSELGSLADEIELGVVGIPAAHALCRDAAWDKKILTALGSKIDFVDYHIGYAPLYTLEGDKDEDIFKAYMAAPTYIKTLIRAIKGEIKTYAKENAENISIQITEYGPMGTHYWGTIGSTFLASFIQIMLEEPMISSANHLPLLNHPYAPNLVGYMKSGNTENYWDNLSTYIFRWYSAQVGRDVLKKEADVPTFKSKKIGIVPAQSRAESASCAVYTDENGTGSLFIINQCTDENLEFSVKLPYERIRITAITELYNEDFTVANTVKVQNLISPKQYETDDTVYSGTLTVTAKPVSVLRIDFEVLE